MSGHRHATISLICMSTHKAMAARCLSYHQAAYGQPAIRVLATAPLRRLALSVLFTIATNSYQTTCTVSERTFNKRQHANARYGVDFSLFMHYDNSSDKFRLRGLTTLPFDSFLMVKQGTEWKDLRHDILIDKPDYSDLI